MSMATATVSSMLGPRVTPRSQAICWLDSLSLLWLHIQTPCIHSQAHPLSCIFALLWSAPAHCACITSLAIKVSAFKERSSVSCSRLSGKMLNVHCISIAHMHFDAAVHLAGRSHLCSGFAPHTASCMRLACRHAMLPLALGCSGSIRPCCHCSHAILPLKTLGRLAWMSRCCTRPSGRHASSGRLLLFQSQMFDTAARRELEHARQLRMVFLGSQHRGQNCHILTLTGISIQFD